MRKTNNWKDDAYKVNVLSDAEIIEKETLEEVLSYAESILSTYNYQGYMSDGLDDEDKEIRANNRKEKRLLESFIKKWKGKLE